MKISLTAGFFVAGIFVFTIFPSLNAAHASVFSFIANALSPEEVTGSAGESKYNSQNIALLQAPLSSNGSKLAMAGAIEIVDNSALSYHVEPTDVRQADQISSYVVRDGDTLSEIAKMFNVSVNTVVWANDVDDGIITPGQTLIILPVSGIQHMVKAGDTLQSIAKKYSSNTEEIAEFNNLDVDAKLVVGNEIIIPNVEGPTTKTTSTSKTKKTSKSYFQSALIGEKYHLTQGIHGHNGKDFGAAPGTRVHAVAAGKVIVSKNDGGWNGGYGNYVVISHPNGVQSLYAHLQKTTVGVGATVSQGEVIGAVGNTGKSTGHHLHLEIRGDVNSVE